MPGVSGRGRRMYSDHAMLQGRRPVDGYSRYEPDFLGNDPFSMRAFALKSAVEVETSVWSVIRAYYAVWVLLSIAQRVSTSPTFTLRHTIAVASFL